MKLLKEITSWIKWITIGVIIGLTIGYSVGLLIVNYLL